MKWFKWAIGCLAVLGIAAGIVVTADLGGSAQAQAVPGGQAEALISQRSGLSLDTIHKMEAGLLSAAADKGSASGMLTPDQANKLRTVTIGPVLDRLLQGVTLATGAPAADLVNGISQGSSLAQIAAAHGVQRDTLKSRLVSQAQAEATTEQNLGLLTPAQASMLITELTTNLDKVVDAAHHEKPKTP